MEKMRKKDMKGKMEKVSCGFYRYRGYELQLDSGWWIFRKPGDAWSNPEKTKKAAVEKIDAAEEGRGNDEG